MSKINKLLIRILLGGVVFSFAVFSKIDNIIINYVLYIVSYIIIGGDIVLKAIRNILRGKVFDENFLMTIATIGAFCISELSEAVTVMLFYQVGELFQSYAVDKSRRSIADLMDIRPDYANLKKGEELAKVDPKEIKTGDTIIIMPGEKVPLDGEVIEGTSMIDTSSLTGESIPREVYIGNEILSGSININGVLTVKVTKEFSESTVNKILDLVENASNKKSNSEKFITKFASIYTPAVVMIAVVIAIVPPLIIKEALFVDWLYRALSFLVISCPCALVISIPLSFFGGIGGSSRNGILVKGSNYLEALAKTEIVVFDKTGTLTKGVFNVQEINSIGVTKNELLELTAYSESYSNHPISLSIKKAYNKDIDNSRISSIEEISGYGIKAVVDNKEILAGNVKLMKKMRITYNEGKIVGTVVHIAIDKNYAGYIVINDKIKEDSKQAIKELKKAKIKQLVMLTGDTKIVGEKIGKDLGLDKIYTELLPENKVEEIEKLFKEKSDKGKLIFVGDGINDAPVLTRADIGIAMGGVGSDAAIEAADVVIMTDEPSKIVSAIKISKKTLKIANQNIVFAISIKIAVLILSTFGLATMWAAIFADVGVSIIAILNSSRVLNMDVKK